MNFRVQSLKEKYLRGWERQATVVLLASALLLTLHRYYSRRSFFKRHFAEYLSNVPLAESHSYYYWFLTTAVTLLFVPALVAQFGTKERLKDYGFQLGNQKLGWSITGAAWFLMIPVIILTVIAYPPFVAKYPLCKVVASSWQAFLPYQLAYWCLHVFVGISSSVGLCSSDWNEIRELYSLNSDDPICSDALFKAVTGGTRFQSLEVYCSGYLLWKRAHLSMERQFTGLSQ